MKRIITPYQKKALGYEKHISLTANAGSGKTFVLSRRFVEIAVKENIDIDNIVAITFTEKAAAELYKKISEEINERLESASGIGERRKLENLKRQFVSANISTIHSFCINALREFAPEAGIDANFTSIDETETNDLLNLLIDDEVNKKLTDEKTADDIKYLIRILGSKENLVQQTKKLIQKRKNVSVIEKKLFTCTQEETSQKYHELFQKYLKDFFENRLCDAVKSIIKINEHVLGNDDKNEIAASAKKILSGIKSENNFQLKFSYVGKLGDVILTKSGSPRKILSRGYLTSKLREALAADVELIEKFFDDSSGIELDENSNLAEKELARFGKKILEFYHIVLDAFTSKKKQRGYLDFEDILILTQRILMRDEVRNYLSKKYKYIMVDEYQDTNEIQYEIFMPILEYLKINNLFVVGDEKQSIYMFRDAELEIFDRTKKEIENAASSESVLTLPHSFRMNPEIAAFVNLLFGRLFANPDPSFNEVKYEELICAKTEGEKGGVEFLITDEESEADAENDIAAKKILQLVNPDGEYKLNYGDIVLLCRKRDQFFELEQSFIRYKIPYLIIGGKGFFQRQVIYDIYNYLSFLLNEDNDAALVGILRSPFCNLSDREIFLISLERGATYFKKFIGYCKNNKSAEKILSSINRYKKLVRQKDIGSFLRLLINETGYISVIASKQNAIQELANLEKLLSISRNFAGGDFKTLYDFVAYLSDSIKAYEDEGQAQVITGNNTVKLMTIHQSKGLEFKAVFLYGCNQVVRNSNIKTGSVVIDKNFGLLTKVPVNEDYFSGYYSAPINGVYEYAAAKKNLAESKRVLYVAATRAANYLFITAKSKKGNFNKDSFIDLIASALNIDFNKEVLTFVSKLKFMVLSGESYITDEKEITLNIPVTKQLKEDFRNLKDEEKFSQVQKKKLLIENKEDFPKKEIISATKVSIFSQCPVKYQLTYELGYAVILKRMKKYIDNYDFKYPEDEETINFADLKGRVIHKILEKETPAEKIQEETDFLLQQEETLDDKPEETIKITGEIKDDLLKFYSSETYHLLKSYSNYQNEFEIYTEENENYLYGIIDKLVIEKSKLIIVDYKTDRVNEISIKEKAEAYFTQLTFYAYVLSKYYSGINNFELRLVFIRKPDEEVVKQITRSDLVNFGEKLGSMINKMNHGDFQQNLSHCTKCQFAIKDNQCVKNFTSNLR